jgi:hypothetical protein
LFIAIVRFTVVRDYTLSVSEVRPSDSGGQVLYIIRDAYDTDPLSMGMQYTAGSKINTLYYDFESDTYFNITNASIKKDKNGNVVSTTVRFDYYLDYDYDSKSGKYFGVGKLVTKESTKDEKSGEVKDSIVLPEL